MSAKIINAILTKDSTYYLERANGENEKLVAFRDKNVRLLGKSKDGVQRFMTGLGHTCFSQDCNFKY